MTFEQFQERIADDTKMILALVEMRGGCTCFLSPPCNNCCEPITEDEAEYLGWERPEPETPLHKIMEQWR